VPAMPHPRRGDEPQTLQLNALHCSNVEAACFPVPPIHVLALHFTLPWLGHCDSVLQAVT
jgi:hypothetical protein